MTRVLLIGATGQIGWELARSLMPLGTVVSPGHAELDLTRPEAIAAAVDEIRPSVIVNAAGYTAVDKAEQEGALAVLVNTRAPAELAKAARRHCALYLHYSTDYVFDGRKAGEYDEDDATSPLNAYGRTMLDGEAAVRDSGAEHVIFRTSWVYSVRRTNFLLRILQLAKERDVVCVVADQFGTPTWSRLIAETSVLALQQDLAHRRRGVFESATLHLTAVGSTSWHGFASTLLTHSRERGMRLKCSAPTPVATAAYPRPAARPRNSKLSVRKLEKRYGVKMPPWETCLELCLADLSLRRHDE